MSKFGSASQRGPRGGLVFGSSENCGKRSTRRSCSRSRTAAGSSGASNHSTALMSIGLVGRSIRSHAASALDMVDMA